MKKFLLCCFSVFSFLVFGQTLSSQLSETTLKLGEPAEFKINISHLTGLEVQAAPKNEMLPFHFEILSDSVQNTPNLYTRVIKFQIFEEGKFKIPPIQIKVGDSILNTIPYEVEVINTAKKEDTINDIMNNKIVDLGFKEYWELYKLYFLGGLLLIGIIALIWMYIKWGRAKKSPPLLRSHQALQELEALKNKKYIENNDFRNFYVQLIDITRNFLSQQYGFPAKELLTEDLLDYMKGQNKIAEANEKILAEVFSRGDLVKFAKIIPSHSLMENDFDNIKEFVKRSYKDIEFENIRKHV
ncbi:BatD family protein [Elizabethkingia argenteiflava]|nr:BatD family protein [Elizabethkingia argenteiflava]